MSDPFERDVWKFLENEKKFVDILELVARYFRY